MPTKRPEQSSDKAQVPKNYVKLVSSDGFEFIIDTECACASQVLRANLESGFRESRTRCIPLHEIRGEILEKLCQYLYYRRRYNNIMNPAQEQAANTANGSTNTSRLVTGGRRSNSPLSPDIEDFDIPDDMATTIELLLAASYLDI